jgi:O-succinylbenzoate synthase
VKIFYSPYELKPRASLSSRAKAGVRVGALLKIEHTFDGMGSACGYSDVHPWPELGDLPLSEQLQKLAQGDLTPLTRRSVEFSKIDARARAERESLWSGLQSPSSHALVTEPNDLVSGSLLEKLVELGFQRIKLKVGRDPLVEARAVSQIASKLQSFSLGSSVRLRLDFNSILTSAQWMDFCDQLSDQAVQILDFIEDPLVWDREIGFGKSPRGIPLALDRRVNEGLCSNALPDVWIIKPAVSSVTALSQKVKDSDSRMVFTSYLDHPLGQLWAAWSAAKTAQDAQVDICGLLSQDAYEPNSFQKLLNTHGPNLIPPTGTGIGWNEELESLCEWRLLTKELG